MLGFFFGNPNLIATPLDPDHNPCGYGEMKGIKIFKIFIFLEYPFIYFAAPNENVLYRTVCISSCPSDPS